MQNVTNKMMIDIIDNGGQWTHREWRMLRDLGVDSIIVPNDTPPELLRKKLDGLVLSGGATRVGITGELGFCGKYLELNIPILGICAGHQYMARYYGGDAKEADIAEFGAVEINVDSSSVIFDGTPDIQNVFTSHNDEVSIIPDGFVVTAWSNECPIQAIENKERGRFGLQFHPEVTHTEFGSSMFQNFISFCAKKQL